MAWIARNKKTGTEYRIDDATKKAYETDPLTKDKFTFREAKTQNAEQKEPVEARKAPEAPAGKPAEKA